MRSNHIYFSQRKKYVTMQCLDIKANELRKEDIALVEIHVNVNSTNGMSSFLNSCESNIALSPIYTRRKKKKIPNIFFQFFFYFSQKNFCSEKKFSQNFFCSEIIFFSQFFFLFTTFFPQFFWLIFF